MSQDATFSIVGVSLPEPSSPAVTDLTVGGVEIAGLADFFGRGPIRPWRRDQKRDWTMASGGPLVASAVGQILGTKAATPTTAGELPWRDEFGSKLHLLRHRNIDETVIELARRYAADALNRWEPRARITNVEVFQEDVPGRKQTAMVVRVKSDLIGSNSTGNAVLLSGVEVDLLIE